jgi:glycosyltransferase involved in cell wall biosynthesis
MAVYNGAAYLRKQLESILAQVGPDDEVVVVDDASVDASAEILAGTRDARIHVERNPSNTGVLATFERALRLARGDVVFLSDQDDVWLPGKVEKVMLALKSMPEVSMVVTDARVIDELGNTVHPSFLALKDGFAPGALHNFMRNKCLGCTMAFRAAMLEHFLPIPPDVPMHDIWFAVLNGIHGKTHLIDEPLVAYRRHGGNASPIIPARLGQMAAWRLRLAKNLLFRLARGPKAFR